MNIYSIVGLIYIVFIFIILGISTYFPDLLFSLASIIKLGICVFLMIRYNPMQKKTCDQFDIMIVFGVAFFMLTSSLIIDTALYNLNRIQTYFRGT